MFVQRPEIRLKYDSGIFLLILLIKANLKADTDLLPSFLNQRESELNLFVDTRSTGPAGFG